MHLASFVFILEFYFLHVHLYTCRIEKWLDANDCLGSPVKTINKAKTKLLRNHMCHNHILNKIDMKKARLNNIVFDLCIKILSRS